MQCVLVTTAITIGKVRIIVRQTRPKNHHLAKYRWFIYQYQQNQSEIEAAPSKSIVMMKMAVMDALSQLMMFKRFITSVN